MLLDRDPIILYLETREREMSRPPHDNWLTDKQRTISETRCWSCMKQQRKFQLTLTLKDLQSNLTRKKKKVKHTATAEDSLVALSHRILRWARFVWAPSHQLRTHWCHLPRSVQARTPQGLFPSGFHCQSFCSSAAGHHQRLASPPNLQGAKGYKTQVP